MAHIARVGPVQHLLMRGHTCEADMLVEVLLTKPFHVVDLAAVIARALATAALPTSVSVPDQLESTESGGTPVLPAKSIYWMSHIISVRYWSQRSLVPLGSGNTHIARSGPWRFEWVVSEPFWPTLAG